MENKIDKEEYLVDLWNHIFKNSKHGFVETYDCVYSCKKAENG